MSKSQNTKDEQQKDLRITSEQLTKQEVCIGSLGQQKVYLNWSDVKDICTYAVSKAYEQARKENKKLCKKIDELYENIDMWAAENARFRELLRELKRYFDKDGRYYIEKRILLEINQVLGEE